MMWSKLLSLIALLPLAHGIAVRNNDGGSGSSKPNFIYIVTDDQDAATATPEIMPLLNKHVTSQGANYSNFYVPVSQCCPSRVGFFRSQYGHSHNVTYVTPPYGGWSVFCEFGYQREWLFTWLQRAGYFTSYVGKLMNGNNLENAQSLPVQGIDESALLLDPATYLFYNATYSFNSGLPQNFEGRYSTDHIKEISLEHLDKALASGKPFFTGVAPIAPHFQWLNYTGARPTLPPVPAERHAHLFPDAVAPRGESFNPDQPSGASYMRDFQQLNQTRIDYNDEWYRLRLRSLQAVDELVDAIYKKVEAAGQLDNTYIIYTADNGYSISQHRRNPGKTSGYEEDIRVPFVIRGPGIKQEVNTVSAFANIDLSASIMQLAGAEANIDIDGKLMPFAINDKASRKQIGTPNLHMSAFWIFFQDEGEYPIPAVVTQNNTYRVIRSIEEDSNWAYAVWCTGERELYDMTADPYQMNNLLLPLNEQGPFADWTSDVPGGRVASRLDAIMLYLKTCRGTACRYSWENIFPYGEATSLKEALDPRFDVYFDDLPKVHYDKCRQGFVFENEFPIWTTELPYYEVPGGAVQPSNGTLVISPVKRRHIVNEPFAFPEHAEA